MIARNYPSPAAFKQALEQRLRTNSGGGGQFARRRQLLVFQRFLARVAHVLGDSAILKGGLVLELRLKRARTTKDIDLRLTGAPDDLLARLQSVARTDLDDFFSYEIRRDDDHPAIQNDGLQYDGFRFRAECHLAGKLYGQPFGVDICFGDPLTAEPEVRATEDTLGFAGIAPPQLRIYPIETHVAEKLHAYTMPRPRPNSRVKDLPDIALLASIGSLDADALKGALEKTFEFRKTHPLPTMVPPPPSGWEAPYQAMAREDQLPWPSLIEATNAVAEFLDPILNGAAAHQHWSPETWSWRKR